MTSAFFFGCSSHLSSGKTTRYYFSVALVLHILSTTSAVVLIASRAQSSQGEAARCRKSDCGDNVGGRNSAPSNASNFFRKAPKYLDLTYKATPIFHHLAKSHGDRPRGLGDLAPKPIAPELFGGGPEFWDLHCLSAHTSNHDMTYGDQPRRLGDIAPQIGRK